MTAGAARPTRRLLLVEDSADDAELIGFALRTATFDASIHRVETAAEFVRALDTECWDAILCDYHLPRFSMADALRTVREERRLEIPFVVVSRLIGEDAAVEAMQKGADDYLLKGRLGRLPAALEAAMERRALAREKAAAEAALRRSHLLNRSLLDSLSIRIAVLDGDGRIIAVNAAWRRFAEVGADPQPWPAHGDDFLGYLDSVDNAYGRGSGVAEGVRAVIDRHDRLFSLEVQQPLRTGSRWEAVRAMPLADSERGAVVSFEDITPRMLSQLALHDAHARLRHLSRRIVSTQEDERRAVALELHDDFGQSLAALKIALRGAQADPASAPDRLDQSLAITEELIGKMRRLAYSLRPPQLDSLGLEGSLRGLAEQQRRATGIAVDCRMGGLPRRPHPVIENACYRIAQEALNNATRHGRASQVVIELAGTERVLQLVVRDDGCGFDEEQAASRAANGGLGLVGMSERAALAGGRLRLRSVKGAGTHVSARFPIEPAAQQPGPDEEGNS